MNRRTFLEVAAAAGLALRMTPTHPRLICYGDSIANGSGASTPEKAWAAIVAHTLGYTLDNRAVDGSLLAGQHITEAGDVTVLLTGFNDMRHGTPIDTYRAQLLAACQTLAGAPLYLGDCLRQTAAGYVAYGPVWAHGNDERAREFNDVIHTMPARHVFASAAYDPVNVTADLVHPNDAGHAQIAAAFLRAMRGSVRLPAVRR